MAGDKFFAAFVVLMVVMEVGYSHHLRIMSPQSLVDVFMKKYNESSIPFSIANYGDVPYGKTISGEVALPSVLEDCVFEELP